MASLPERLLEAADRIDELSRSEIQVMLRHAAVTIRDLRKMAGIRDEAWLEDEPPEGSA